MYLMKQVMADLQSWLAGDLATWMRSLRQTIESVRGLASSRAATLLSQLDERIGPVLKISRSKTETLRDEMEKLARESVRPSMVLLGTEGGEFQGLFAVKPRQEAVENRRIFLALKSDLQSPLLRRLEAYGTINVANEIKSQGRTVQVADHYRDAESMSVSTRIGLVKAASRVPSFLLARDNETGTILTAELSQALGKSPEFAYQPLPLLDHMVVFYQEGACSVEPDAEYHAFPDVLTDSATYEEHFAIRMKDRPDILDPLRGIKGLAMSTAGGGAK
jgi:hypothetical protein